MSTVRASSLPLAVVCPQSLRVDQSAPVVRPGEGPADLGTAFHAVMAAFIVDERAADDWFDQQAARPGIDADELRILVAIGRRLWLDTLRDVFPEPQMESAIAAEFPAIGLHLTGHADVYSIVGNQIRILDWKTGWRDSDHWDQQRAYGAIIAANRLNWHPDFEVVSMVVGVREQRIDTRHWTCGDMESWLGHVSYRLASETYSPGPHCEYCPRRQSCDAARDWMRNQVAHFSQPSSREPGNLSPSRLAEAVRIARAVAGNAEKFLDAAKERVREAGGKLGPLELSGQIQKPIDAAAAWDTLVEAIGLQAVVESATISKGKIEAAVKDRAAPRMKGKDWSAMLEKLESCGGLTEKYVERLVVTNGSADTTTESIAIAAANDASIQ